MSSGRDNQCDNPNKFDVIISEDQAILMDTAFLIIFRNRLQKMVTSDYFISHFNKLARNVTKFKILRYGER
jgi:hypothetical protein